MNVPSEPGFTPVTIISLPVHTVVRSAAIGFGASAIARHGPAGFAVGCELEPTKPAPIRIAAVASTSPQAASTGCLILASEDMVPPMSSVFWYMARVCARHRAGSMDGTWTLDGIWA